MGKNSMQPIHPSISWVSIKMKRTLSTASLLVLCILVTWISNRNQEKNKPKMVTQKKSEKAGFMLGISGSEYAKALCSPRVKVGSEYVIKGQTVDQVYYALGAICKAMFERLFNWLVAIVNRALSTDLPRSFFIGILDIAGFEIFEFNTFEQLCI